jgi:hypothetical protein
MSRWLWSCVLVVVCFGCEKRGPEEGIVEHARYGIFFGGQIQEREEIPFSLDRTKQRQGFRVDFRQPLPATVAIKWEIDRPGLRGKGRKVVLGEAHARAGATSFEQELPFQPGDPLGTWNVRVTIGNEAAIDRPVLVFDDHARKVAREEADRKERAREDRDQQNQDDEDETK